MANPKLKILILATLQFIPVYAQQSNEQHDYAFMSAQDLYDALEHDAPIAVGYMLGVTDGLKGRLAGDQCFRVPWIATADQVIKETYMAYWLDNVRSKVHAVNAVIAAMSQKFPCDK